MGQKAGIKVIPAVELSIRSEPEKGFIEFHLLGYCIDHEDEELKRVLDKVMQARIAQKTEQIKILQGEGLDASVEEVFSLAKGVPGRLHIAEVVMRRNPGRFASREDFIKEYLIVGGKAYVKRPFSVTLARAIEVVVAAGGVPVLAHPGVYVKVVDIEAALRLAQVLGLRGLEIAYPYNKNRPHHGADAHQVRAIMDRFEALADQLGLLKTGGSDFHGQTKDIELGEMGLNYEAFEAFMSGVASPAQSLNY